MDSHSAPTVVIGGGVVGLSAAIHLQRAGQKVTVIDPLPSPGGASFGNAGMISADSSVPMAMPGMLRKVPGWLMDPLGPLAVRPAYLAKAMPWLLRWMRAGQWGNVLKISDAMRAIQGDAFAGWRALLGADFDDLLRPHGQAQLWETAGETPAAALERQLRERQGIPARMLGRAEIEDLFPGITPRVQRGLILEGNGYTVSPPRLVRRLEAIFRAAGGERLHQSVLKILPQPDGTLRLMTNVDLVAAGKVVLCAGAWSARLLAPLGIRVPLETERGYHVTVRDHGLSLGTTLMCKSRSFGMTPMEEGLRVAGTVEFAGLDRAPDERRATQLIAHLREVFPGVNIGATTLWMGHRPSLPDSLPVIGATGLRNLYCDFGHGHFGMTGAPASGRLLAEIATGQAPSIDPALFALDRPLLRGLL